ncbi:MAG TPA: TMEM175 family protein [Verrucomicrobiae bacterium]|nr:TMEM175 family protein [Verrucomicrobiae bacterium]
MTESEKPGRMPTPYNRIAGGSVERLAALSDGIFGVAMTLLLLELHVPAKELIHNEADLLGELAKMGPSVVVYLMSFITLGIFWVGQQTQLNHLERSDRHLTWMHLGFLFAVTLLPFSTRLLASFVTYRTALLVYWGNILLLGVLVYFCWARAVSAKLVREEVTEEVDCAVRRRVIGAQALYAAGAALCIINTYVSIAFIVLVQINFAVAPRIRWLSKI